jgi:hypothetical protein
MAGPCLPAYTRRHCMLAESFGSSDCLKAETKEKAFRHRYMFLGLSTYWTLLEVQLFQEFSVELFGTLFSSTIVTGIFGQALQNARGLMSSTYLLFK